MSQTVEQDYYVTMKCPACKFQSSIKWVKLWNSKSRSRGNSKGRWFQSSIKWVKLWNKYLIYWKEYLEKSFQSSIKWVKLWNCHFHMHNIRYLCRFSPLLNESNCGTVNAICKNLSGVICFSPLLNESNCGTHSFFSIFPLYITFQSSIKWVKLWNDREVTCDNMVV